MASGKWALPHWIHWILRLLGLIAAGLWLVLGASLTAARISAAPVAQTAAGEQIYTERCAACHGEAGDGAGPAAERLFVKPRDFTRDEYKIKSTAGDEFPSRADLIEVISDGMPGSSMPGWAGVLTEAEIGAVADYIQQTFGRFFVQEGYGSTTIEVPGRVNASDESIARGRALYESDIECAKCHGEAGRGDGPSAFELTDSAGHLIYPADLTQPWTFRGGMEPEEIYLRLRTGLAGSPMPSFADALSEDETWDLVNYILSLSPPEAPAPAVLLVSHYVEDALPDDADDPAWAEIDPAYYPLTGQLMRAPRYYQPAINAIWVKSLYNDTEIAFHVAWNDRTETGAGDAVDALALQFPQDLPDGAERPYFFFGDSARPVYQWHWSAAAVAERNARGLQAVADQAADQQQLVGNAQYAAGRWQVVFRRPLQTEDEDDMAFVPDRYIPLSYMAWEGQAGESGERLGLTTWSLVYLSSPTPAMQYASIPGVMLGVAAVELLLLWSVRRNARNRRDR
jgi:DMSO reductase family type II enzyme heme b subunit